MRSAMAAVPPVTPAARPILVPAVMKIFRHKCSTTHFDSSPISTGTAANPPVAAMVKAPPTKVRPPATTPEPDPIALAIVLFLVTLATVQTSENYTISLFKCIKVNFYLLNIGCDIA